MNQDTIDLALLIADDAARADIECYCTIAEVDANGCLWYNVLQPTPNFEEEHASHVMRAFRYLQQREKVEYHTGDNHWIKMVN